MKYYAVASSEENIQMDIIQILMIAMVLWSIVSGKIMYCVASTRAQQYMLHVDNIA